MAKTTLTSLRRKQLLDDLFEGRQQARVVRGDAPFEVVAPLPEMQDRQILVLEGEGHLVDDLTDVLALLGRGQPHVGATQLLHGGVAPRAAEDEEDRGEQMAALQQLDTSGRSMRSMRGPCEARTGLCPAAPLVRVTRTSRVPLRTVLWAGDCCRTRRRCRRGCAAAPG